MGRRGNKRSRGRGGGGRGGGSRGHRDPSYSSIPRVNTRFEEFYTDVNPVVPTDEMKDFWRVMRTDLPNSFRFTGSKGHALVAQQNMKDVYFPKIQAVQFGGEDVDPPRPVTWFPGQLAWYMTTPKQVTRRFAPLAEFQKFLVSETSIGNVSRQEVVSMIPPLFMDIKPWMTVLDLCAAPGSKTAQLIEALHAGEEARVRKVVRGLDSWREMSPDGREIELDNTEIEGADQFEDDDGRPTGLVIANDVDYRRAHMLVHQTKRLNSPNIIVTNHDASMFPSIEIEAFADKRKTYLKFDRILADVPCSGDGTCRKNLGIWKDWRPGNGLGLHAMQARILVRALQMLKVNGRVVYSTCSLNPIENEAVVASAIERCGGSSNVRIVDCSSELPGLRRRNGQTQWKVMDKSGDVWPSWDAIESARITDDEVPNNIIEGMFPPSSPEDRQSLRNCMRVYPHDQDTGGFFITVLEKLSEIKAKPESRPKKAPPAASTAKENGNYTEQQSFPAKRKLAETDGDAETSKRSKTDQVEEMESGVSGKETTMVSNQTEIDEDSEGKIAIEVENGTAEEPIEIDRTGEKDGGVATENDTAPSTDERKKIMCDTTVTIEIEESADPPLKAATMSSEVSSQALAYDREKKADTYRPKTDEYGRSKKANLPQEEVFKYIDATHPAVQKIFDFYQIHSNFPRDRFMTRNATGEPGKAIYYTSEMARQVLTRMEGQGMKFVHCGVKMFVKQDVQGNDDACEWRIQSDGLSIIEPWVLDDRVIRLYSRKTLHKLLKEMFPLVARDGWKELGEIGERVLNMSMGCCILRIETSEQEDGFKDRMVMPLWRGVSSVNLMLPKEERKALLLRLYEDDSELIDNTKARLA